MEKAAVAVKSKKMGYLRAAKHFNVPRTTLYRYVKKNKEIKKEKLGRKAVLPPELEEELVQYLLTMESKFFGLTRKDVRSIAYQLAKVNKIEHFQQPPGKIGYDDS